MAAGDVHGEHPRHVSYLLRLWQAESEGRVIWRASLQSPNTGERRGFASLADLLRFLEEEYGAIGRGEDGLARGHRPRVNSVEGPTS